MPRTFIIIMIKKVITIIYSTDIEVIKYFIIALRIA